MFSNIKKKLTFCLLLKMAFGGLFLQQSTAWAAVECRFNDGYGGTTTLTNSSYTGGAVRIPPPGGGVYTIATFSTELTPALRGECSVGDDGESLWAITDTSVYAGTLYQHAIYKTNIPGVVYTVRIQTTDGYGGYFYDNTTSYANVGRDDGVEGNWNNKKFIATIVVSVNNDFHGNPTDETTIHPQTGTLGKMSLGYNTDSNNKPWTFAVNESSFSIPVTLPTCDIAALSTGENTVDMGEYYLSEIKSNNARKVPFTISASNCTSVASIITKVTSTTLTGNGLLLGNTISGEASGMGVKIFGNDGLALVPNNTTSTYTQTDTSIPGTINLNFTAQMVPDGGIFKAGEFKATSIFTLSYE